MFDLEKTFPPSVLIKSHKKTWHDIKRLAWRRDLINPIRPLSTLKAADVVSYIWYSKKWFMPKYTTKDVYLFNPDMGLKYFSCSVEL